MHDDDSIEHEQSEKQELERIDRVQIFASRILRLASEEVSRRSNLESRWLADLEQYEGQYDAQTLKTLKEDPTRSKVFVNITRSRVNAAEARIIDMLFPTDDKNWGIKPTPVPKLSKMRKQADKNGEEHIANEIEATLEAAEEAAKAMETEIDDQLSEASYNEKARDAIHDAALFGTGILKAPVIVGRTKKVWHQQMDENGQSVSVLEIVEDHVPTVQHVSIWNYFPDSNAARVEDCDYELERHYMTRRQLADLLKAPGFFHHEIAELLKDGTGHSINDNGRLAQMRAISGLTSMSTLQDRYEMWEYHGAVDRSELDDLGVELDDDEIREFDCVVFVCNNRVIKAVINPMETADHPYSVMPWQKDESSIFGKSVPWLMRDSQGVVNGSWRTLIENMGLSSGDQIVADRKGIQPANGKWQLEQRKLWFKKDPNMPISQAFATFPIQSHQAELMAIVDAAGKISDEETNMPRLMYGENPGSSAETMGGMAMQMNAANVVLRRAIKNFDDRITRPLIKRFYDFNMQFSTKEEIKGDMNCKARGSSALLVKEQQAASLMQLMQVSSMPGFAELTKAKDLYRKVVQSMHLDADDIIKSDDEISQMQDAAQQQPQDPAMMKMQADMQMTQMRIESQMQIEQMKAQERAEERQMRAAESQVEREIAMMRLSADQNLSIEQINAKLRETEMNNQSKRELQLREIAVKGQFGQGL